MAAAKKTAKTKPADTETSAADAKAAKTKPAKAEKAPKVEQEKQNGIARPKDGTTVGKVWAIADKLSKLHLKTPEVAKRKDVLQAAENEGINAATAATQYGRWRRFNGIVGRADGETE